MRNHLGLVIALMLGGVAVAQTASSNAAATDYSSLSQGAVGSPAVWQFGEGFLAAAHAACDRAPQPADLAECFIQQMVKAGASAEAVQFTRELYQSSGQLGFMGEYKAFGPVGLAWVVYPLRLHDHDGLLILHGDPKMVDPDDVQKLNQTALQKAPAFLEWKKTAPHLKVFPGNRGGGVAQIKYARVWPGAKPGDQRFMFTYPLFDGCKTCTGMGFANYWWEFDGKGKFLGTQLISVSRGAPPINRRGTTPGTEVSAPKRASPSKTTSPPVDRPPSAQR